MCKHHETLEIQPGASADQVKTAYRIQAQRYHPDFYKGPQHDFFTRKMQEINEAFRILMAINGKCEGASRTDTRQTRQWEDRQTTSTDEPRKRTKQQLDDARQALVLCRSILHWCSKIEPVCAEFAIGVAERTKGIQDFIEKNSFLTNKQFSALENMYAGCKKWKV